jgi:hypothetical protein
MQDVVFVNQNYFKKKNIIYSSTTVFC